VLAFARKDMGLDVHNIDTSAIASSMTFLGLIAMVDPPRDEAIKAVATCHAAGVDVKMITGDHAATAATIAQQIGIRGEADPADPSRLRAVTGRELQTMSDEEFNAAALRVGVFARVAPEQKLRLVQALRAHGHVVAMTGDGVNDAPALRAADIGVAMGKGGTDVAKDAADIVLTDDNFASIVSAVEEGRTVFDNLRKFIVWTIPTNIGEGMVLVIAVIMGGALPILPVQILWINMTTAILLGLPLAFEPMHPNAMMRRPRNVRKPVFTRDLIGRTLTVSALLVMSAFVVFHLLAGDETDPLALRAAQTAAANTFVVMQMFYLFNCRTISGPVSRVGWFSNPWVWAASVTMMAFQMAFTYLPFMNEIFHTAPVPLDVWVIAIASGAVMSVVIAIEKKLRHRNVDNDQR
jgi:magnesium-transporting ATPase (P-type)